MTRESAEIGYDDLDYMPEGIFLRHGQPFTGVTIDRYPDGRIQSEVSFKDGYEHGVARDWYPNGQPAVKVPFISGVRHGLKRE